MNLRELEEYALEESFSIKDALWKVKEKAKSLFKFKSKEEPVNDSISKPGKSTNEEADMLYEDLFFKTLSYPEFDKKLKHLLQIVLYRSDKSIANANTIIDLASKIVTSKDSGECKDFLDDVSKKWDSLLKEYKNNVVTTDANGSEYNYFELNTYKENPLVGELLFSTAWRLSKECGYEGINKYTIIGDLSLAQQHFYRFNYNLSEKIRNLRHLIQRNELSEADINWLIVAQNIDAAITPKIDTIIDTYGSNMWDKEQISV